MVEGNELGANLDHGALVGIDVDALNGLPSELSGPDVERGCEMSFIEIMISSPPLLGQDFSVIRQAGVRPYERVTDLPACVLDG